MIKTVTACSKPKHCPACGSKRIENILYSSPDSGRPAGGMGCENGSVPKWRCSGCGAKIHLKTSRRCRHSYEKKHQ